MNLIKLNKRQKEFKNDLTEIERSLKQLSDLTPNNTLKGLMRTLESEKRKLTRELRDIDNQLIVAYKTNVYHIDTELTEYHHQYQIEAILLNMLRTFKKDDIINEIKRLKLTRIEKTKTTNKKVA